MRSASHRPILLVLFAALAAWAMVCPPGLVAQTMPVGQDVPELPESPMPAMSGPYGSVRTIEDFRERAIITAERGVVFQEGDIGYGQGRTVVEYNQFILEADYLLIDMTSGEIQAEGNVIFRGPKEFIKATSGRFNLVRAEGVAYGVDGQVEDFYFRAVWDETENGPAFRQIDENLSIFRGSYFTTSAFPVPQYYVKASEVILVRKERVHFRNPVLWVRGVPMFWLPFYTRSLDEGSPWSQEFGYGTDMGFYFRLGYRYVHRTKTPSWDDPTEYETRSHGLMDNYLDLMSERGIGIGTRYRYQFDYYRHTGYLELYGLRDTVRDVDGEEGSNEFARWVYRHKHYSELVDDDLIFQLDADEASDPDVYVDVLDRFAPDTLLERGRLYEQRTRAALTLRHRDQLARIALDHRERLARDYYLDHSEPNDDDLEFDPDPDYTDDDEFDEDGWSSSRYADVSRNVTARYATRLLNLSSTPLYYRFKANAFDSLDAGMNNLDTIDDARVRGGDLYGGLTHRLRLGERTTWSNSIGVGTAYYYRDSDELVARSDFEDGTTNSDGTTNIDDARFKDTETIVLGDSDTERSMADVDPFYLFAEYESRLNHRFTDFLDGYIKYKIRQGTSDSLGEFYESTGRKDAAEDVYAFYTDHHYIEPGLNYYLRYPNLYMSLYARENLQGDDDIYPNEELRSVGYNINYANQTNEFRASLGAGYSERQLRDLDDPNSYVQREISGNLTLSYLPRHARYWARLMISGNHKLEDDPVDRDNRQKRRFDEDDTEVSITPTIGRQFGPKYRVQLTAEYNTRYEDIQSAGVVILRDLADAELGLFLGVRNDAVESRRDDSDEDTSSDTRPEAYEYDIRATVRFKINRDQPGLGQRSITTLSDLQREAQYVR